MASEHITIVGAGIAGLACSLLLARQGRDVTILERAEAPSPVGAGIQLGPNATRLLDFWGLGDALRSVALEPTGVQVREARTGAEIARRHLAAQDAPWLCVHRAELHRLLLDAAVQAGVCLRWGTVFHPTQMAGSRWVAADGAFGAVRAASGDGSQPQPTGHWAWRCLLPLDHVPAELRESTVRPWWGAAHHVVTYPVRLGGVALLNVVAFTRLLSAEAQSQGHMTRSWAEPSDAAALLRAIGPLYDPLARVISGAPVVTRWPVVARAPLQSASGMLLKHQGQALPLVGDAAHPMRPYMAQGAAMALEDAATLAACLQSQPDWSQAVQTYAQARWSRNAMLQARSERNGKIFHLPPPFSWARNAALRLRPSLMDSPEVYNWHLKQVFEGI